MNDDQLTERIDPSLAVDRALTVAEALAFRQHALAGVYAGAEPSDWISYAIQSDANLDIVEPWMARHADEYIAALRERHALPDRLTRRIIVAALYASIPLGRAELGEHRRSVIQLAGDAMLWARGYAERCGWTPNTRDVAGACPDGRPGCLVDHHS